MRSHVLAMLVILTGAAPLSTALAQDQEHALRSMISRYVGTWDLNDFLNEPPIRRELEALLGTHLDRFMINIGVTGGIEFIGGALAVSGNAPHQGTEEEAIVCIQVVGAEPMVHVGIFSHGKISVHTRQARYEYLPTCLKDWITEVNTGHRGRAYKPDNVRMVTVAD